MRVSCRPMAGTATTTTQHFNSSAKWRGSTGVTGGSNKERHGEKEVLGLKLPPGGREKKVNK